MKTIYELSQIEGRVYVYLANVALGDAFMEQAEDEGFTFTDGAAPTKRCYAEIMALNKDKTINYVGSIGRMAFGGGAKKIGDEDLVRVDYEKFIAGNDDYMFGGKA